MFDDLGALHQQIVDRVVNPVEFGPKRGQTAGAPAILWMQAPPGLLRPERKPRLHHRLLKRNWTSFSPSEGWQT